MTKLVVENDNELFNNLPYNSLSNILQNPDISRIHQWHSQVVNHFKDSFVTKSNRTQKVFDQKNILSNLDLYY